MTSPWTPQQKSILIIIFGVLIIAIFHILFFSSGIFSKSSPATIFDIVAIIGILMAWLIFYVNYNPFSNEPSPLAMQTQPASTIILVPSLPSS